MSRADWGVVSAPNKTERSNVMITITDNAAVAEGELVTAVCNNKTFTSTIKNGIAKLYTSEVGTYTITVGEYSTMLVCPYFGVFSTDIYSGALKVTCLEVGGNNKTCHVQSCNDNYDFTDDYNLTQTFDNSLELTFLGIPTGKYLVTVDDRYRFFKEITSIQNVNEIDVELKQWLYKNGDECIHNTGGWMRCLCNANVTTACIIYSGSPNAISPVTHTEDLRILSNCLEVYTICNITETSYSQPYVRYARSQATLNVFGGTKKQLPLSINRYNQLTYNASKPITFALRSGAINNTSTYTSTATVLASGTSNNIALNLTNTLCSVVFGITFNSSRGYGFTTDGQNAVNGEATVRSPRGNINETFISDITEIYLI